MFNLCTLLAPTCIVFSSNHRYLLCSCAKAWCLAQEGWRKSHQSRGACWPRDDWSSLSTTEPSCWPWAHVSFGPLQAQSHILSITVLLYISLITPCRNATSWIAVKCLDPRLPQMLSRPVCLCCGATLSTTCCIVLPQTPRTPCCLVPVCIDHVSQMVREHVKHLHKRKKTHLQSWCFYSLGVELSGFSLIETN